MLHHLSDGTAIIQRQSLAELATTNFTIDDTQSGPNVQQLCKADFINWLLWNDQPS